MAKFLSDLKELRGINDPLSTKIRIGKRTDTPRPMIDRLEDGTKANTKRIVTDGKL